MTTDYEGILSTVVENQVKISLLVSTYYDDEFPFMAAFLAELKRRIGFFVTISIAHSVYNCPSWIMLRILVYNHKS